jgi:diguanylate cyclase (GGDEF)-like protein/PAS domain S-box-containing protein
LADSNSRSEHSVLIVHPDSERAASIGQLVERHGGVWKSQSTLDDRIEVDAGSSPETVIISEGAIPQTSAQTSTNLRSHFPEPVVLVGLIDTGVIASPQLFGAGMDLILYEPLVVADIERALAFSRAIHGESREQARERLRKMTALHELAVAFGHRTGAPGWLDRLVEAGSQILGADALAMWAIDREENSIRCVASVGLDEEYICTTERQSLEPISHYDEIPPELSTAWLINEEDNTSRIVAPDAARAIGVRQVTSLPVRDSNRLYGHLSFYFVSDAAFKNYDLVLADAFSSIVAAALGTFWLQSEIRRSNRLYREHVESSPDGVIVCHPDGTVERSNPAIERITGRDRYEIIGQSIFDWFITPDDLPWGEWATLSSESPAEMVSLWLAQNGGQRRRVSCYARRVTFPDPRRVDETEHRIQVVIHDITLSSRRLIELELFHDLTRLISDRGSLEEAYDLVVSRLHNYLDYRLVAIGRLANGRRLELKAFRTYMEDTEIPTVLEISTGICGRAIRENTSLLAQDVSQDPDYYSIDDDVLSEIVAIIRAGGKPIGIIDIQTDATQPLDEGDLQLAESIAAHLGLLIEQVSIQERLERQALTDPLTGMANRRAFMRHLHALVNDPASPPAGLMLVELDHFKSVNDRYGHLFGDEMLKQVGRRLRRVLREHDVLARYGGDEIAMIFFDLSAEQAMVIAERLRAAISSEPFKYGNAIANLTVSIGIALFPYHGHTTDELIAEADRAMYAAKLEGRNAVKGHLPLND